MKITALILSVVTAVAVSSCCCQKQAAPKLRHMPTNLVPEEQPGQPGTPAATPGQPGQPGVPGATTAPVEVLDGAGK